MLNIDDIEMLCIHIEALRHITYFSIFNLCAIPLGDLENAYFYYKRIYQNYP